MIFEEYSSSALTLRVCKNLHGSSVYAQALTPKRSDPRSLCPMLLRALLVILMWLSTTDRQTVFYAKGKKRGKELGLWCLGGRWASACMARISPKS